MRDAAGLVAPLSWLAVWNRQLIAKKSKKSGGSDSVDQNDDDEDEDNDDPDALDRSGVLYSAICKHGSPIPDTHNDGDDNARNEKDLLARRTGLAQGLVDFTRSFASRQSKGSAEAEEPQHIPSEAEASKEVAVVQSQNQRLVFLQPETDYWIVAAFARFLPPSSTTSQSADNPTSIQAKNQQANARLYPSSFLPNTTLEDLLKRAYAEFRLLNGTFNNILQSDGQDILRDKVTAFFGPWKDNAKLIPLGIPRAPASVAHEFLQPPSGYNIIAVSHSGILETPTSTAQDREDRETRPPELVTMADRLALSCYLATFLSVPKQKASRTNATTGAKSSMPRQKDEKAKEQARLSSSTWKSLHLSGITSYLPYMPGMHGSSSTASLPSVASPPPQGVPKKLASAGENATVTRNAEESDPSTVRAETGKRSVSGSAWMPRFGLFSTSSASVGHKSKSLAKDTISPSSSTTPSLNPGEHPETVQSNPKGEDLVIRPRSVTTDTSVEAISEATFENTSREPTSSATRHSGAARRQGSASDKEETDNWPESSVQSKFRAKWHSTRTVFIGDRFDANDCQCLCNDDIAMALIPVPPRARDDAKGIPSDDDRAIIDQYFTHLATLQAYPPPSASSLNPTLRTFLSFRGPECRSVIKETIDDRASASSANLGQRYNLAINAKTDTNKLLQSDTRELFVRTYFSQWLVAQRDESNASTGTNLTILPKSIGKEGSLLDADTEIRRLSNE